MSVRRAHKQAHDDVLKLRLPAELKLDAGCHAGARGETLSEFARRAFAEQIVRDRIVDRDAAARQAFADGVFEEGI